MTTHAQLHKKALDLAPSSFEGGEIFRFATGLSPHSDQLGGPASPGEIAEVDRLLGARASGYPLQYLLGEWAFYGLPFCVGPGVLIPRQDTETLVDAALSLLKKGEAANPEVLDLCSGSGCLAIAIKHHFPAARVGALEASAQAFAYIGKNCALNGVEIAKTQADLRDYTHPRPLDLIVSNPPYIPRRDFSSLQTEVTYEPIAALDGGHDGLDFFRVIARRYKSQLAPGGHILLEVGDGQSGQVAEILTAFGYRDIAVHKDLTGRPRVIEGCA